MKAKKKKKKANQKIWRMSISKHFLAWAIGSIKVDLHLVVEKRKEKSPKLRPRDYKVGKQLHRQSTTGNGSISGVIVKIHS